MINIVIGDCLNMLPAGNRVTSLELLISSLIHYELSDWCTTAPPPFRSLEHVLLPQELYIAPPLTLHPVFIPFNGSLIETIISGWQVKCDFYCDIERHSFKGFRNLLPAWCKHLSPQFTVVYIFFFIWSACSSVIPVCLLHKPTLALFFVLPDENIIHVITYL